MAGSTEVICQICQQQGHAALDCPQLEAAAAARRSTRHDGSAYAQLVNYGTITINQVGGMGGEHGQSNALARLPTTMGLTTSSKGDALAPMPAGVKKHHHHHKLLDHDTHHHHHHDKLKERVTQDAKDLISPTQTPNTTTETSENGPLIADYTISLKPSANQPIETSNAQETPEAQPKTTEGYRI